MAFVLCGHTSNLVVLIASIEREESGLKKRNLNGYFYISF